MPDRNHRSTGNVPGAYYVDHTCIDCDLCRSVAPALFARNDDAGTSFVQRQPSTPAELELAEEARALCPTETIGCDGDEPCAPNGMPIPTAPGPVRGRP